MDFTEDQFQKWCRLAGLRPEAENGGDRRRDLQRIFELTKKMEFPPEDKIEPMIRPGGAKGKLREDKPEKSEDLENEIKSQKVDGEKFFIVQKKKKDE